MIGVIGRKIGMTRIFIQGGISIPVTVIEVLDNIITQIKSLIRDKYNAIQVTTGYKKKKHISKSELGHFIKSNVKIGRGLWEFRVLKLEKFRIGQRISVNFFQNIKKVDVSGCTKGKGFSGTIKRWNFKMQDATHGNSLSHRVPGSIGQNQTPGRVFKGKKMAGHLGNEQVTVQNLKVIKVYEEKKLLLIKGSVPGYVGSNLKIVPAIKVKLKGK